MGWCLCCWYLQMLTQFHFVIRQISNQFEFTVYQFLPGFAFSWLLDKQLLQEISHPNRLMALLTDISAGRIVSPLLSYWDTAKSLLAFASVGLCHEHSLLHSLVAMTSCFIVIFFLANNCLESDGISLFKTMPW